ncbi:hypothetical protein Dda_2022 [Drechslerella dactyloides]|uniref:Uncharacterized protein n=1 Tax=Drechslerella dactyloides TaxID=74499 RepID=A0AAD6J2R3_DREDA|nr:hypothetical protein Dda_2022 [Drechslerella dactyloides]
MNAQGQLEFCIQVSRGHSYAQVLAVPRKFFEDRSFGLLLYGTAGLEAADADAFCLEDWIYVELRNFQTETIAMVSGIRSRKYATPEGFSPWQSGSRLDEL